MQNSFIQQAVQQQTQQLTPAQLQGLHLLTAPLQELETLLSAELESNPLLEVLSPGREELAGDLISEAAAANNDILESEFEGDREEFPLLKDLSENWNDTPNGQLSESEAADVNTKHDYQLNSLTSSQTLVDILFEQLSFFDLPPRSRQAAELVIGSLDERGFLASHPADIAMAGDLSMDEVNQAIKLIQSFDPPGVGAANAAESLILQLQAKKYPDERIYTLLRDHSEDLELNKLPKIAKDMKISIEDIYSMLDVLKTLNTSPASGLENYKTNHTVIAEMSIEQLDDDTFKVSDREGFLPKLGIVSYYLKLLENPSTPEETSKYLKEKLAYAEALIKSLALRQDTLKRITEVIAEKQADFFRYGVGSLQPMTMAEVANKLELHETTVSRAVSGKYLDTPQGLKEYKFFFSGGYKNADGEDISSRGVKEIIKNMIEAENPAKPLSDAAISKLLAGQGLDVARRTVAKYRESMNIAPTNLRRRH